MEIALQFVDCIEQFEMCIESILLVYTPENIAACIEDLRKCEEGESLYEKYNSFQKHISKVF